MTFTRLDVLRETIKSEEYDKHFYEVVDSMTAEEWAEAISNQKDFAVLIPYLIFTYDNEKVEAIHELIGEGLGQALATAWFEIYHANSHDEDEQPTIAKLGEEPCLVPLLSGHLLKMLETAGYGSEFNEFVRIKHNAIIKNLVEFAGTVNDRHLARIVYGAGRTGSIFPIMSDYDTSDLPYLIGYAYLLSTISYASDMLCLQDFKDLTSEEDLTKALNDRKLEMIVDAVGLSETKKRRCFKDLQSVEQYIKDSISTYMEQFSSLTVPSNERVYLASLFASGVIGQELVVDVDEDSETVKVGNISDIEIDDDGIPSINLDTDLESVDFAGGASEVMDGESSSNEQVEPEKQASAFFNKIRDLFATDEEVRGSEDDSEAVDELIISNKPKKRGFNPLLIAVVALGFMSWLYYSKGEASESESIIGQQIGAEQQSQSLPVVKVHTK
ncbi:hypothetical protein VCHA53O466_40134 [Vibrio chagasii]|nr:hypothetical protein VCHA53O466_40134 [Vibrio chagasii]